MRVSPGDDADKSSHKRSGQDHSTVDAKQQLLPGVSSLLLDENACYSTAKIDLPVGADAQMRQTKRDLVIAVVGGGPLNLIFSKSPNAEQIATDEVRFLARDTNLRILNSGDKPSQALVIELQQHWDAEVRTCVEPMKCFAVYKRFHHRVSAPSGCARNTDQYVLLYGGERSSLAYSVEEPASEFRRCGRKPEAGSGLYLGHDRG
jgi:hypothetical protein